MSKTILTIKPIKTELLSSSKKTVVNQSSGQTTVIVHKIRTTVIGKQGHSGRPLTFEDLTPEQIALLKGDAFTYEDFTPEQLEALRGADGEPFTYEDFTPEQLASLKGEAFTYDDFTPAQLESLKGDKGDDLTLSDFDASQEVSTLEETDQFFLKRGDEFKRIGNIIEKIPDATTTERGLLNIGTQTFGGNKTLIGESSTVGNAFEILNSSLTSLVKVGNNGNIGIGITPSSYKFHVNGAIYCSYISCGGAVLFGTHGIYVDNPDIGKYSFGGTTPLGARPLLLRSGNSNKTDGYISFYTSGLERLRVAADGNVGVGITNPTAKLSVFSDSSTTGSAFDIKNSQGLQIATFNNNRAIEFGDSANPNYSTFFKVHGYMQATRFYIGTSTAYWSNDGVGMRVVGGYMVVEGTASNPMSILAMRKSTFGYVNDSTTPTSEMFNVYGNIKIGGTANGILMYTPDGLHQYKLSIDNNGLPVTTLIS